MSFIQNFVGFCRKSSLAKLGKSDTVNMFVSRQDTNEQTFNTVLRPMPGYEDVWKDVESSTKETYLAMVSGNPQGMFRVSRGPNNKPMIYGVWGNKLVALEEQNDGSIVPHLISSQIVSSSRCSFCETSGYGNSHPHLVICDGTNLYCVDTTLSFVAQSDYFKEHSPIELPYCYPDSTTQRITPSWVAYLYGYLVVGAEGTDIFYRSYQYPFEKEENRYDIFDLTETGGYGHWTMSEWQPDNTIVGGSNGSRLFTMGETSFQVFVWQDSTTMPFSSPDTASKKIGITNKDSFAIYADNVFWLGSADHGTGVVYSMTSDGNPQRVSTESIEEIIAACSTDNIRSHCLRYRSHVFYILTFLDNNVTLVYDVGEGDWIRLSSQNNGTETFYRYYSTSVTNKGKILTQAANALVKVSENTWLEHDGTPILRKRIGGMLSSDNKTFKIGSLKLITNNGEYPLPNESVNFRMRICRNGQTFDDDRIESEIFEWDGEDGEYDYDPTFKHLGKAKYFTIEVSTASNIPFALYGIDVKAISCG